MSFLRRKPITYHASPLSLNDRERFQTHQLSMLGEMRLTNSRAARVVWTSLILGYGTLAAGFALLAYIIPDARQRVETHWIGIDQVHGSITPIAGVTEAPLLFKDVNRKTEICQYVELYYEYTWQLDRKHHDLVQLMSSPEQFARYVDWSDGDPLSPKQKLKRRGTSQVDHCTVDPRTNGDAKTFEYTVRFKYREESGGQFGVWEDWIGDIQFQEHPELVKDENWALHNGGGFYATYFKANKQ